MNREIFLIVIALLLIITLTTQSNLAPASAQSGGASASPSTPLRAWLSTSYDLTWSTIDGGGGTFSTGGNYSLGGTIGQPDASSMSGGTFTLNGGFWGGGINFVQLFMPLIAR